MRDAPDPDVSLLAGLREESRGLILPLLREATYPKGATIVLEGQPAHAVYFLRRGLVKVCYCQPDGREVIVDLIEPGAVLGEVSLFSDRVYGENIIALTAATVLVCPADGFLQCLRADPALSERMLRAISDRLRRTNKHVRELVGLAANDRVVASLVHIFEVHGTPVADGVSRVAFRIPHTEIAKMAGVSRETASKVLAQLQPKYLRETSAGMELSQGAELRRRAWML